MQSAGSCAGRPIKNVPNLTGSSGSELLRGSLVKMKVVVMDSIVFWALLFNALMMLAAEPYAGQPYSDHDLFSDTWVATDALGRAQPGFNEAGPRKPEKQVALFYWTWHIPRGVEPHDNTKLIAGAGDGKISWPGCQEGCSHHWGEPELGYYLMTDSFVIRKHVSMLTDAGVDLLVFDTSNPPFTWKDEYEALCRTCTQMRQEGNATPQIAFLCPFGNPMAVLNRIYNDLYQPGLWEDLWYMQDGKPLVLANPDFVKDQKMRAFFTFRRPMPDYRAGPSGADQWSWLELYPQHAFKNSKGEVEQVSVGVAQNAVFNIPGPAPMSHKKGAMGRSWHNGAKDNSAGATARGLNFDEQWKRAMELDPKLIFVTGWNEWVAGRFTQWSKFTDADVYYPGGMFVDQYNQEYSRDCEPMAGGHTDNYYYQLSAWIRRFKGVRPPPVITGERTMSIDGSFDDWKSMPLEFRDTIGDVVHRNHPGYGTLVYTNTTGRNDFVLSKAAYDKKNLYFFVQTRAPITPSSEPMWMMLLIDSDQNGSTGWLGYDYIVNQEIKSSTETTLKSWNGSGWNLCGTCQYRVNGNGLELSIPRQLLRKNGAAPAFDFHWADNIQSFGGVEELGVNGDSAPNRRWNYRF